MTKFTLVYNDEFLKSARKLPKFQKQKPAELLELFQSNPFHPKLHTKHLTGKLSGFYSFRITRDWRVIFKFLSIDTIQLIYVGHRKEIYKTLGR